MTDLTEPRCLESRQELSEGTSHAPFLHGPWLQLYKPATFSQTHHALKSPSFGLHQSPPPCSHPGKLIMALKPPLLYLPPLSRLQCPLCLQSEQATPSSRLHITPARPWDTSALFRVPAHWAGLLGDIAPASRTLGPRS